MNLVRERFGEQQLPLTLGQMTLRCGSFGVDGTEVVPMASNLRSAMDSAGYDTSRVCR